MTIYVVAESGNNDKKRQRYHMATIYRSPKIAFNEYVTQISEIVWDFNTYLDDIVSDIKLHGKNKAQCSLFVNNTTFSLSDLKGNYAELTIEKKEYDPTWKRYIFRVSSLKLSKKNIKDVIKGVKLLRDKDEELYPQHPRYWTNKKIETLVNDIFEYGSPNTKE